MAGLYLWLTGPLRRRHGWAPRFPWRRAALYFGGLALMFVTLNGPVHDLSDDYLFSVHMVQHLLLTEVWAPLFILGLPAWLVALIVRPPALRRLAHALSNPVVAGLVFSASIGLWHAIPFYDAMMRNHSIHIFAHITFMVAAVIAWWPVCCPIPEGGRLSEPMQMLYLFVLGIPMMIVAALITLSNQVLYPWYSTAPRVWGLTPLMDQQLGGLIMWVPGGLALWIAITVIWFSWNGREARRREAEERAEDEAAGLTAPNPATTG